MSECYSHHIKLGRQRGAKLGLAASQTKPTWKNVRHYMCLGHSICMDYCEKKTIESIFTMAQLFKKNKKQKKLSPGKVLMYMFTGNT